MEDRYQLFETIERLTGKTLVESELDEICRLFDNYNSLKKENKRLVLQNEVLSAAFANISKKENELMKEKAEMMEALRVIYSNRPKTLRQRDLQEFAMWFCQAWEEDIAILVKKADNKQNADE